MIDPALRIIDANLNRAREALRVLEDVARFALGNEGVSRSLKRLRHGLAEAAEALPVDRAMLVACRDAAGDVGAGIKTERELERDGLPMVAAAAAGRLTEALRSLEETSKAINAGAAARAFEATRYGAYSADKMLTLALGAWGRRRQWRLCVLLTESLCAGRPWLEVAAAAMDGGADCVQLREKSLEGGELLARARRLVELARARGVSVIINDRPDIAVLADADGVQLGQSDIAVADARAITGSRLLIGVSTENLDQARAAVAAGADYCGVGPMFPTTTKHKPRLVGPEYLRAYLADEMLARVPHLAIGGITSGNILELRAAGVRGVAVSAGVCGAESVRDASAQLLVHVA